MSLIKFGLAIILISLSWVIAIPATAQVVLNEICSYNGDNFEDEEGDEPDWIELYNPGSLPVALKNYYLQGNDREPWIFPDITLQPQSFLIVFASGKNRIAPLLHTNFELSRSGELLRLYNANGTLIDFIDIPTLHLDHSYGRKPDGMINSEGIFNLPTPGSSNQGSNHFTGYAADPVFSLPAGLYNGTRVLEISNSGNGTVYLTTDGNIPVSTSSIYTTPILIDQTIVIKARALSSISTELPSRVITATYILNYNQTLPVFSISTNPDNLWDWNNGIYVSGPNANPNYPYYGSNFWLDIEIPAFVEFFEMDSKRKIAQNLGISIHGGTSNRSKPMKSLRLSNKNKYGGGDFQHRFFPDKNINQFRDIVLHNSSGDFNKTHFRDGSLHKLMIGKTNIDLLAYRPSAVFLNGVYHGVHNIREKINKFYLEENYGIDGDNVDLLEEDSTVIEGDFNIFNSTHAFVTGNSMADKAKFDVASGLIDMNSLCDYYIAETFLSNIDWPYNNVKFWRSREPGSKFRYILIDLDIALGNNGWAPASFDVLGRIMGTYGDNNRHVQIFRSLLNNPGFREYFINRYADLVNTLFSSANMERHINETREILVDEMPLHFNKWGNDMAGWDQEIYQVAMPHIYDRPGFAMEQVKDVFSLTGIVELDLDVWPLDAGKIIINTITPDLPWQGKYFNGNPVTIAVHANPGYKFVKWSSSQIPLTDLYNQEVRVNPSVNNKFTAFFSTSADSDHLMVYPNPIKEKFQFGCVLNTQGNGRFEIINAKGQIVLSKNQIVLKTGIFTMEVDAGSLTKGVYVLKFYTADGVKSEKLVIL